MLTGYGRLNLIAAINICKIGLRLYVNSTLENKYLKQKLKKKFLNKVLRNEMILSLLSGISEIEFKFEFKSISFPVG